MTSKKFLTIFALCFAVVFALSVVSAAVIEDVRVSTLQPGEDATMVVTVKNPLDDKIKDVSLSLSFADPVTHAALPISSVGSSEYNVDEIQDDDAEDFTFNIRASNSAAPGDYNIPYTLTYDGLAVAQTGTIGITVEGTAELDFSTKEENPVIDGKGKITLKIVNKGFADAKFVSVKINPSGYTLLSENEIYVGTISSDDFEAIDMDVIFGKSPAVSATLTYKDFNNHDVTRTISLPVKVYSREKAIELGIIKQSYALVYLLTIAVIILLIVVIRTINKRRRMAKSRARAEAEKLKGS